MHEAFGKKRSCRSALVIRNGGNRFLFTALRRIHPRGGRRRELDRSRLSVVFETRWYSKRVEKRFIRHPFVGRAESRRSRAVSEASVSSRRSIAVLFPPYRRGRLRAGPPPPSYVVANHRHADQMPTILLSPVPFMDIATPLPH